MQLINLTIIIDGENTRNVNKAIKYQLSNWRADLIL